jgi:hypothetical protein
VFPVRYELHFYILFIRNSVLEGLMNQIQLNCKKCRALLDEAHNDLYSLSINPSLRIAESSRLYWDRRTSLTGRQEMDGRTFVSIQANRPRPVLCGYVCLNVHENSVIFIVRKFTHWSIDLLLGRTLTDRKRINFLI